MVKKEKTEALFAEADSDFADVLFSILTLPLGKIAKVLVNHYGDEAPLFGSISTLYTSLANLDDAHFVNEVAKIMLMNPWSSFEDDCRNLKHDISYSRSPRFCTCRNSRCEFPISENICMYYGTASCDCGGTLNKSEELSENLSEAEAAENGVFTKSRASFVIADDLWMAPYATVIQTLRNLGISIKKNGRRRANGC